MKKKIMIPLSVMAITLIITGCANTDSTVEIGKSLNTNLNNLSSIVCKLDTVDNTYIANPDLQEASKLLSYKNDAGASFSLAVGSQVDNSQINDLIRQLLYNKLSERLTQNRNGNCKICNQHYTCDSNGFCNNCNNKILCDSYGNCTNCGARLHLSNNNTCTNCNDTAVISKSSCSKAVERLNHMQDDELTATRLNTKQILNNIKNNKDVTDNELVASQLKNRDTNSNLEYKDEKESTPNNFHPHVVNDKYKFNNVKYNPRHYNDMDSFDISEQIDNYIAKIQKLYAMSSDTLEANTILSQCKNTLLDSVAEVKELNKAIINGTCTPSGQQIQALKNYIDEIKYTVKKLKNCNGDLTEQVKKINKSENANITTSVDVMNSNYISILNQIDTRIAYHESAISTLEQIKYLLEDAIQSGKLSEEELIKYNEELNNIQIEIEDEITNETDNKTDTNDTSINQDAKPIDNSEVTAPEEKVNAETEANDDKDNPNKLKVDNQNESTTSVNEDRIENTQSTTNNTNQEAQTNNSQQHSTSNIDTYKNDTVNKNVDTMISKKQDETNTQTNLNNEVENDDNTNINNNTENQNSTIDENLNDNINTDVVDNNNDINDNNTGVNTLPQQVDATNSNLNKNQNNLKNGVIYQNNLNTGNNVQHRYYYGDDGKVHNTTNTIDNNYANQSANTNNAQFNADANNTNNNVNTYGYNSMLDVINQGTVNNGINNL